MSHKKEINLNQNVFHGNQTLNVNYNGNSQHKRDFLDAVLVQDLDKLAILIISYNNEYDLEFKSETFTFAYKRNKTQALEMLWTEWKRDILDHVRELIIKCVQNNSLENESLLDAVSDKYLEQGDCSQLLDERDFAAEFNSKAFKFCYEKNKPMLLKLLWKNWNSNILQQIRELFTTCIIYADIKNEKLLDLVCRYNFEQIENLIIYGNDFDPEFKSKAFKYMYYKNYENILTVLWQNWKLEILLYGYENKNVTLFSDSIKYILERKCTEEDIREPYYLLLDTILNGDTNKMTYNYVQYLCRWDHRVLVEFTLLALQKHKYEQLKCLIKVSVWAGYTVLEHAIKYNDEDLFRLAVLAGANPYRIVPGKDLPVVLAMRKHFKDVQEYKDLHEAVCEGNELMTIAILNNSTIKLEEKDKEGYTPLILAARNDRTSIIARLVEMGADKQAHSSIDYNTALHFAAARNNYATLKMLVQDVNLDCKNRTGRTPLHVAVLNNHLAVASFLVDSGANIDISDYKGRTPLHTAAEYGFTDIVQLLLKKKASGDAKDRENKTALDLARANGHLEIIKLIRD